MCLQELGPEARDRFSRFEEFVKNDTQEKLDNARAAWNQAVADLGNLDCTPQAIESNLEDLAPDHTVLAADVGALMTIFEETRMEIVNAIKSAAEIPGPNFNGATCVERLETAAREARETAERLKGQEGVEEELLRTVKARATLELLEAMKKHRAETVHEITRRKQRDVLESVKTSAATTGITKTITQLSEDNITEVVRDRFTRESQDLNLDRITIAKTRAEKGSLLHQTKLVGAKQRVTVPQVFSEGEKSALGLAAFFTEAELDASKSTLILDDPVSSLDHIRRRRVAKRLAVLGENRQVIVFTHDTQFVRTLKQEALERGVTVTERSVSRSRGGEKRPGACEEKHPWNLKNVRERLKELEDELQRIRRESAGWDDETYRNTVQLWAGRLSQTWELIVIQEIVDRVLDEGGQEVRPKMLKIISRFDDQDHNEYEASYWRVSGWAPRHEQVDPTLPDVQALEDELNLARSWWKRIRAYQQ